MRRLVLAFAIALAVVGGASAEVVARGVQNGMLALGPKGTPFVAYVRGSGLLIATRASKGRWRATRADSVSAGSQVMAFTVGVTGPVALVQSADDRTLVLVRRRAVGWQTTRLAGALPAEVSLGWPGLVLDRHGLPVVAYTRWHSSTQNSQLVLALVDARGRISSQRITREGFPKSYVPPPAAPVLIGGRAHVFESYGHSGSVGTIEWYPQSHTWIGLYIDAGLGDFPVGPLLAGVSPSGTAYAAWTESLLAAGELPVTLAVHGHSTATVADFVFDRALTTALAATASGPEVAANEWVAADEVGLAGQDQVWAGAVVGHGVRVELDGWIGGLATAPRGARDLLLAGPAGLSWFRSSSRLTTRVSIDATAEPDGRVLISGGVRGASGGRVTLYRERPGARREAIGHAALANGSFSFVDSPSARPLLYRAVYTDPASGIPYAALLRAPVT
jgi:hypothetical protein